MSPQTVGSKVAEMCIQEKAFGSRYARGIASVERGEDSSGHAPVVHKSETWFSGGVGSHLGSKDGMIRSIQGLYPRRFRC